MSGLSARRVLGLLLALVALPAAAQTVVDGDTIKLDGITYRIWGIDAAETSQSIAVTRTRDTRVQRRFTKASSGGEVERPGRPRLTLSATLAEPPVGARPGSTCERERGDQGSRRERAK